MSDESDAVEGDAERFSNDELAELNAALRPLGLVLFVVPHDATTEQLEKLNTEGLLLMVAPLWLAAEAPR